MSKFLDETGLAYFWGKIKAYVASHQGVLSYLVTHPETTPHAIFPFMFNDIAFLQSRGGSVKIYYDNVEQTVDLGNCFDGSPNYGLYLTTTNITSVVVEITCPFDEWGSNIFSWGNDIYVDFGLGWTYPRSIEVEVMNSNYQDDVWTSYFSTSDNNKTYFVAQVQHIPVGASDAGAGFNKIRISFSDFPYNSLRLAEIGVYTWCSEGVRKTYMSRGRDDGVWRSITPWTTNVFSLGSSSKKWNNVWTHNINGVEAQNIYSASNPPPDEVYIGSSAPSGSSERLWIDTNNPSIASTIFDAIYPVGSIYMSVNSTSPATLFGGTWQQIQDRFLLSAGSTYTAGDTGGEAEHTLTLNESPAHTHTRGTMDITGMIRCGSEYDKGNSSYDAYGVSGAFFFRTGTDNEWGSTTSASSGNYDAVRNVNFKASKSWTGETDSKGGSQAHNNMPPYLVVYMWKRIA